MIGSPEVLTRFCVVVALASLGTPRSALVRVLLVLLWRLLALVACVSLLSLSLWSLCLHCENLMPGDLETP